MSDVAKPHERLEVGPVLSGVFATVGKAFPTLAILTLVLWVIPQAVLAGLMASSINATTPDIPAMMLKVLPTFPVLILVSVLFQGSMIHAAKAAIDGRKANIAQSLAVAFRHFLPVFAVGLVVGLGIMAGLILLVVPGIILALMWCVAAPVQVNENLGVFASISRSRDLTRGSRWMIVLLTVIFLAISWVASLVGGIVGVIAVMAMGGLEGLQDPKALWPMQVVVNPLISGVTTLFSTVGLVVIYSELRRIKEGFAPGQTAASVFD